MLRHATYRRPYRPRRRPMRDRLPTSPPEQFSVSGVQPGALGWRVDTLTWRAGGAIEGKCAHLIAQAVQLAHQHGLDMRDPRQAREALESVFMHHTIRCTPGDW